MVIVITIMVKNDRIKVAWLNPDVFLGEMSMQMSSDDDKLNNTQRRWNPSFFWSNYDIHKLPCTVIALLDSAENFRNSKFIDETAAWICIRSVQNF